MRRFEPEEIKSSSTKMLGHLRSEIATQYARNAGTNVELEARFGEFRGQEFQPGISLSSFQRINDFFAAHATPVRRLIRDDIRGDIRRSTVTSTNPDEPETVTWIRKVRVWNHDVYDYNLRLSMSREEPIEPVEDFTPTDTRIKDRRTYTVFDGTVQIDLTIVTNHNNRYEVEVELLNPQFFAHFERGVLVTLKRILNTVELYTTREANTMVHYVNSLLGGQRPHAIDNSVLVQARDLKIRDMVMGGLIGNPATMYTVTHKADGERRLLVFHESGIWLVMAPRQLNRVSRTSIPQLHGTILDGEDIPLNKRLLNRGAPESTHWYLVFDCLARQGNNNIQTQPHSFRMQHGQGVANIINAITYPAGRLPLLQVTTKTFRQFTTPEEFYSIMDQMFAEQSQLSYEQDGFMFTPGLTPYNPHSDRHPLHQRTLTRMPDICKWKPKTQLTIDFLLRWGPMTPAGRTLTLLSGSMPGAASDLVAFTGSNINPFDVATMVDTNHVLTQDVNSGTIVEYAWDFTREVLYPVRIRHEKARPNRLDIAQDVWDDIHHPIEERTLKGDDFTLVFAYHNRIKRGLYDFATQDRKARTLLDIGAGRGGDVAKWKHFQRIVAVEPNEEHVVELRRRIEVFGMTDRVRIVVAGGQDQTPITAAVREFLGGPADVVSMMLSLSFFWQSPELLDALVTTIQQNLKPDGKFIFLTIDGDAVQQLFDPMFRGPQVTELNLTTAMLRYDPPRLHVDLPGTIVGQQTEWLVRLQDLLRRNFNVLELHRADGEPFLSPQEIIYTKMYTFGAMIPGTATLPTQLPVLQAVLPAVPIPGATAVTMPQLAPRSPTLAPVSPNAPTSARSPTSPRVTVPTLALPPIPTVRLPPRPPTGKTVPAVPTVPMPLPLTGRSPQVQPPPPTIPLPLPTGRSPQVQPVVPTVTLPLPTVPTVGKSPMVQPVMPTMPLPLPTVGKSPMVQPVVPTVPLPLPTVGKSPMVQPPLPTLPVVLPQATQAKPPALVLPQIPNLAAPKPATALGLPPIPTLTLPGVPTLTLPVVTAAPLVPTGPVTLATLPVYAPKRLGDPGVGDDAYQPLRVTWYDNVVRIAAIGDGSCFFHSVCKAYLRSYQNNPSYAFRTDFVARLRRDMAFLLGMPSGDEGTERIWALKEEIAGLTGKPAGELTFYDTAANGAFLEFYSQQVQGFQMYDDDGVPIDYSLAGMQRLLNSTRDVGYEVYQYVADLLGIDIFVTIGYTNDLRPFNNTRLPTREPRPAIVIVGNRYHYEVVALNTPQGLQTMFFPGHPFIEALMQQRA